MTNHISQTDPATLSTEEIFAEIAGFKTLAVNVLIRWSALLAELKRRRVRDAMFNHPVLKFWESINNRMLDAEAAVLLADKHDGKRIKAVLPLPPVQQVAIARGEPVPIATRTDTGEIRSDDLPIQRMDDATMRRAFGPHGIRTVHEQAEMIRAEGKIVRIGGIVSLRKEGVFRVGNVKLTPEQIDAAGRDQGFRFVPAWMITDEADTKAG